MKVSTVVICASLGMGVVGSTVYAVTPGGGYGRSAKLEARVEDTDRANEREGSTTPDRAPIGSFTLQGKAIDVDARLSRSSVLASSPGEAFVLLELKGREDAVARPPTVDLALVIDKSGSMIGGRIESAIAAGITAVDRLHDGDVVSVVAFDTSAESVVPPTVVGPESRASITERIRGIRLGGDTCISCGIEAGMSNLQTSLGNGPSGMRRIVLLSDGKPTNGAMDVSGFAPVAARSRSQEITVTTIGVGLDYNETFMSGIAVSSNGNHYFVENPNGLPAVFDTETATLARTVATSATAEISLAPGVELVNVFDRQFDRSGSRISVPLGAFASGERKTVLLKVRLPRGDEGELPLADVRVIARDSTSVADTMDGTLAVRRVGPGEPLPPIDSLVIDRLQKSETAAALNEANTLFAQGRAEDARRRLDSARTTLAQNEALAKDAAPASAAARIDSSFDKQKTDLDRAVGGFASPPPPAPGQAPRNPSADAAAQQANAKKNAVVARDAAF